MTHSGAFLGNPDSSSRFSCFKTLSGAGAGPTLPSMNRGSRHACDHSLAASLLQVQYSSPKQV